jgi:hypothetical protein
MRYIIYLYHIYMSHMYTYIFIYIYVTHVYIYIHIYIYIYVTHVYIYIHIYICHTCIHIYITSIVPLPSSPCALTRYSPYNNFSPVLGSRVKQTPVPEVSPILPNTCGRLRETYMLVYIYIFICFII